MPESEQPNGTSDKAEVTPDAGLKSLEDFGKLPLAEMEKELSSKDYTKAHPLNLDQDRQDSETSEETSDVEDNNSTEEQVSDDDDSKESESEDSQSKADKQNKKKDESLEDRFAKLEKSNKELQAEFTRRSQKLKEMEKQLAEPVKAEKSPEKTSEQDDPELAQLKEKDPKAYDALNRLIDKIVDKRVTEKVKPVEEQVTLRKRQDNAGKFNKAVDEFLSSPLKELEMQMVDIINENPSEWQRTIWENDNAFEALKKELIYRHTNQVAKLLNQAEKNANADSTKKERLKEGQVGTKTKVSQPTKDVMSDTEFRKLSLSEMEKRLPKVRR